MKQKLLHSFTLRVCLLVAMFANAVSGAWAESYEYTFESDAWSQNGSATLNNVSWTLNMEGGTISNFSSTQGMHFGTNKSTCNSVTISSSGISGTITSVKVEASRGSSLVGTLGIKVGSTAFKVNNSETNALTTSNAEYDFTGNDNGNIEIKWTTTSGKGAYYIKKITITYSTSGNLTTSDLAITGAPVALSFDLYDNAAAQTVSYTTSSTGEVTVSGGEGYVTTSVDATNKTITVTPTAVTPSAQTITVSQAADENYAAGEATFTVTVSNSATYTVTLGDDNTELVETAGGAGVTLPSRSAVGDYTFAGWSTNNVTEETTTAPTIITTDDTYHPTANITLYPVYTKTESSGSSTVVDELNRALTGVTGTSYSSWSGKTGTSGAVYAGFSAGGNESIQLRTTNNTSGIVTTTSGGKAKKVSITWNNNTSDGRSVNVYGSNSAYNGANNLYSNDFQGTLLGTISYPNNEDLTIDDDYEYIGIRSKDGALYLTKVEITWAINGGTTYYTSAPSGTERVAQPTITIPDGVFVSSKLVTITTETDGAAIQYSTDGGETWTNYSEPFSISATTTVQAKATKSDMDDSYVATETFTKETVLEGLAGLTAQTNTSNATYYVNLTNAQVTYVMGNNGFMEDATAGIYVYSASPVLNKVYNGIFQVTYQVYNGLPELKAITAVEGTVTDGSDKAATVVALSTLTDNWTANLGRKVQVKATLTSAGDLADGYSLYKYDNNIATEGLKTYTLVGYPYIHSNSPQFNIISAEEVQLQDNSIILVGPDYTIDVSVSGGGEVNMTSVAASHGTLQSEVVLASTTVDASKYTFANNVLTVHDVTEGGVIVIRYWVDADTEYNAAELLVPIYLKANPIIAYDGETESTAYGTPYTIDTDLISGGDITLSSSNTAVATVDGLTITPVAVGSTTITINTADANIWHAGTATFTLSVTAPAGKETAAPSSVVTTTFTDKDLNYAEGGIAWTASTDAISFESSNFARGVQFGAAIGEFTLTATGKNVTKVSMVLSTNGTGNTVQVNVDGESFTTTYGEIDPNNVLNLTSGMNKETVEFTGSAGNAVTITVVDANKSVYIKSITLYQEADPLTATLNASGYATYCSEYPLDFSDDSEFSAWEITNIEGTTITFNQITGTVKGGTGVFLKGTAGATVTLTSAASTTELGSNLLEGTTAPTYVTAGEYFGLKGNEFVPVNAGTIPAGKALLPESVIPASSGVKAFTFVFVNTATGVRTVETVSAEDAKAIFNLAGQRVNKVMKGIFIKDGKKVIIK